MIPLSGPECILNFGNVVPRCLDGGAQLGYAAAVRARIGTQGRDMNPMVAVVLRPASAADADALTALMKASAAYSGVYAALLDGYRITAAQIARDHFVIAEGDGRLLGFYSLTLTDEPELDLLFVADAAQGLGIGRVLMLDLIEIARVKAIASVKIVSHPPSLGFYLRHGAVQVGIKPASGRATWDRPILMLPIPPVL